MSEVQFVPGLIVKAPHEKAPDLVKAAISIKVEELGQFLREQYKAGQEWVNCDVKVAKSGRWYVAVNTYKPNESREKDERRGQEAQRENQARSKAGSSKVGGGTIDDDLPFRQERDRY